MLAVGLRGCAAPCLLALALLVSGCATTHDGSGGHLWAAPGRPEVLDEDALRESAEAETARTVEQVWALAGGVREVGARLSFTFWAERGALTLVGYEAAERGGPEGRSVDAGEAREALGTVLAAYAQQRTGAVELVLRREEAGWGVDYASHRHEARPPEAKTLPVRKSGAPGSTVTAVTEGVGRLLRAVEVPAGGAMRVEAEAVLQDGRVEGWELRRIQVTRGGVGGKPHAPSASVRGEVVQVLLPLLEGLGPRTVRVGLRLVHRKGEAQADGWVEEARVVRASPPPGLDEDVAAEYRALHEDILRRWREEVEEGFTWLAMRGAQELALWYVGAIAAKGAGLVAGWAGGVVQRALGRGGEAATGWLRTMLARLSGDEKRAFERLWAKVQLEGEKALSAGERQQLRTVMARIEQLAASPLGTGEKHNLRRAARDAYKKLYPDFERIMDAHPERYPVHHRRPLEYAHLFPDEDINAPSRLAVVQDFIHSRVSGLWTKFRSARRMATRDEVEDATRIIDSHFGSWYHRVEVPKSELDRIQHAEQAALSALRSRFPFLD